MCQLGTFQSQACTLGQHRTPGVVTGVSVDALKLKREASCKSISEVCGQSTKSLVFQMCSGDCALAQRPELEVLSQSENISVLLG